MLLMLFFSSFFLILEQRGLLLSPVHLPTKHFSSLRLHGYLRMQKIISLPQKSSNTTCFLTFCTLVLPSFTRSFALLPTRAGTTLCGWLCTLLYSLARPLVPLHTPLFPCTLPCSTQRSFNSIINYRALQRQVLSDLFTKPAPL